MQIEFIERQRETPQQLPRIFRRNCRGPGAGLTGLVVRTLGNLGIGEGRGGSDIGGSGWDDVASRPVRAGSGTVEEKGGAIRARNDAHETGRVGQTQDPVARLSATRMSDEDAAAEALPG